MVIATTTIEPHWNYLHAFEGDLERLARYVEFHDDNFRTFSLEITRILLAAGAEADVVCKHLCRKIDSQSRAGNIHHYQIKILTAFPRFADFQVTLPRYGLTMTPWENWHKSQTPPDWWNAYNKVKHERTVDFQRGSLSNALNAVAGLLVAVLYLYKEKAENAELLPPLRLLTVSDAHYGGTTHNGREFGVNYEF